MQQGLDWDGSKARQAEKQTFSKNFKRLVSETMALYRHEAKTRNRYHLGASFDLGFTRIKKELEAPRPKNRFLVKFGFSVKIHLYHPKGGLLCKVPWKLSSWS